MGRVIAGPNGENCCEEITHETIKLDGEKTTTLYVDNPERLRVDRVLVDDCAIVDGVRCDWLLLTIDPIPYEEIYVELKRSDVPKALEQLAASIAQLSVAGSKCAKRCYVVTHRNPISGTDMTRAKKEFKDRFSARLAAVRDKSHIPLAA